MLKRILIIEDEAEIKKDLVRTLSLSNYETLDANNGMAGLELAKKYKPDLIISDIMMPRMDGYQLLRELQKHPSTATIPFLFLSAKTDKRDIRAGMKLGADDFITKPYDINELLEAISIRLKKQETNENLHSEKFNKLSKSINRSMPHEIRTPLSLVLGYSDYLLKKYDSISPKDAREMLGNIKDAANRLNRLYENFLFYTCLENIESNPYEKEKLKEKQTFLSEIIIRDTVSVITEQNGRRKDIRLKLAESNLKIAEDHLVKITQETLINCMKFSEENSPIEIYSQVKNGMYYLSFTDYGRGMTQEQINNIDVYIQFDRSIHEQQGTGLGLAIVRKIAELYGGALFISSEINKYTTVTVQLPVL